MLLRKMKTSLLIRIRRPGLIACAAFLTTTALALVGGAASTPQSSKPTEGALASGQSVKLPEAISREVTVWNFGQPTARRETLSREVTVFNFQEPAHP